VKVLDREPEAQRLAYGHGVVPVLLDSPAQALIRGHEREEDPGIS